jgi:hypothetical protein
VRIVARLKLYLHDFYLVSIGTILLCAGGRVGICIVFFLYFFVLAQSTHHFYYFTKLRSKSHKSRYLLVLGYTSLHLFSADVSTRTVYYNSIVVAYSSRVHCRNFLPKSNLIYIYLCLYIIYTEIYLRILQSNAWSNYE